jgi:hypothetical protein
MTIPPTTNRPVNRLDSQGRVIYDSVDDTAFRGEYNTGVLIYVGLAKPGAVQSDEVWQIKKLEYTGTDLTSIKWPQDANGVASSDYIFAWDLRATYTYS